MKNRQGTIDCVATVRKLIYNKSGNKKSGVLRSADKPDFYGKGTA